MNEIKRISKKSVIYLSITIIIVISLSIFIPMFYCASAGCGEFDENQNYTDITVDQAYQMINDKVNYTNLIILDVRTLSEYNSGHINDSILIPYDELDSRIFEISSYIDTEIIVYCRTGARSRIASEILVANNFTKVFNMLGGISGWTNNGYPVI